MKQETLSANLVGVYVELDTLLDTRIATVARLAGDDIALSVLNNGYHQRLEDKFEGVDMVAYKSLYAARDVETLKLASVTQVMDFLREIVSELTKQAMNRPYHNGSRIVINTYPYVLADDGADTIVELMQNWMRIFTEAGGVLATEVICISKQDLTPAYCLENFSAMLMYEYNDWFSLHQEAFRRKPIPGVTLYAPAIFHVKVPTQQEIEDCLREATHPLRATEVLASPFIHLDLIGVDTFSLARNK